GVPALGTDPHRHMIVVNLLDEGEQMRASLASADRHGRTLLLHGTGLSYHAGTRFEYHRGRDPSAVRIRGSSAGYGPCWSPIRRGTRAATAATSTPNAAYLRCQSPPLPN